MYTEQQIIDAWYDSFPTRIEEPSVPSLNVLLVALKKAKHASGADLLPHVPAIPRRDH